MTEPPLLFYWLIPLTVWSITWTVLALRKAARDRQVAWVLLLCSIALVVTPVAGVLPILYIYSNDPFLMKKFFKFMLWLTAVPWFLHLFKAAFSDIPRATNQEVDSYGYIASWVFAFWLLGPFTVIWAFFASIRWIFIHPYFIAPSQETLGE